MRFTWNFLIIIIAFILQNTIMQYFSIFGFKPDLVLVAVVCFSFLEGQVIGSANGFISGVFQDLVSLRGFGINTLSLTIVGYASGLIEQTVFAGNLFLVIPAVAIATIINEALYLIFAFLVGYQIHLPLFRIILFGAVYNGLLSAVVFTLLSRFWQRFLADTPKGIIG